MQVDFVVPGTPRTPQTNSPKSRNDWKARVGAAAAKAWPRDHPPFTEELSAVIVHFYTETTNIDVDGIAKLILDALKGAAIEDDGLISQVLLRKTNQAGLVVSNPTPILADTLGSHASFVYVRLGNAPDRKELPR